MSSSDNFYDLRSPVMALTSTLVVPVLILVFGYLSQEEGTSWQGHAFLAFIACAAVCWLDYFNEDLSHGGQFLLGLATVLAFGSWFVLGAESFGELPYVDLIEGWRPLFDTDSTNFVLFVSGSSARAVVLLLSSSEEDSSQLSTLEQSSCSFAALKGGS